MDDKNGIEIESYECMPNGVNKKSEDKNLIRFDKDYSERNDGTISFEKGDTAKIYPKMNGRLYVKDRNGLEIDIVKSKLVYNNYIVNLGKSKEDINGMTFKFKTWVNTSTGMKSKDIYASINEDYKTVRLLTKKSPINCLREKNEPLEAISPVKGKYTGYNLLGKANPNEINTTTKEFVENKPVAEFIDEFIKVAADSLNKEVENLDKLYNSANKGEIYRYNNEKSNYVKV